jgi:2-C-methyl-D-erythritol 4-phosphate cytidylyltransferase
MNRYILIVAGGKGLRMGHDLPKQFIPVHDQPVLMHTLTAFYAWDASATLVLALPEEHQSYWKMLCKEIGFAVPHHLVVGGETRFHSVKNGLDYISGVMKKESEADTWIAVHDGVRPFVSGETIERCFDQAQLEKTAVPVVPIVDSLRQVTENRSNPVDRTQYVAVQTPQVFRSDLLFKAYTQDFSPLFTDDASVLEALGESIHLVEGNPENIKITTPFDLLVADALFSNKK